MFFMFITLVEEWPVVWDKVLYVDRIPPKNAWEEVYSVLKQDFNVIGDSSRTDHDKNPYNVETKVTWKKLLQFFAVLSKSYNVKITLNFQVSRFWLTDLVAVDFDGSVVHLAHGLDFQMVPVHVPVSLPSDVLVEIFRYVGREVILIFHLKPR